MIIKARILLIVLLLQNVQVFATSFTAKVIGIKDGDTIEVLVDNKPLVVRLEHIDCPEKKQAFGNAAKQQLGKLCFGKMVTVSGKKYDRNKRLIAEILLANNVNVNMEMVRLGYAWHFKKYSKSEAYANLEISARKSRVGLWQDATPIAPWEFRAISKKTKAIQ